MKKIAILLVLVSNLLMAQQFEIKQTVSLPKKLAENSGIIYDNNQIITLNDSKGKNKLYLVNPYTGEITRTVKITNAKNNDWEDLAQDDDFIYIADTGNNKGNRTDLVIYKISKKQFYTTNEVKAEEIHFSYEDQYIFEKQHHTTNFDCEAITIYHNQLILFTKNWGDYHTNVYKLPLKPGRHKAVKIHTLAIECLLTSIAFNNETNEFIGTAYDRNYSSYLVRIHDFYSASQNIEKIDLTHYFGQANQVEAITWKNKNEIFISRERLHKKIGNTKFSHNEKLYLLNLND
ncbi:hypothetical protein N9901_03300 [Flavobacteriaceae bacterium]|nr:hypothetical protein [Flavobacteriaceae bacterium]